MTPTDTATVVDRAVEALLEPTTDGRVGWSPLPFEQRGWSTTWPSGAVSIYYVESEGRLHVDLFAPGVAGQLTKVLANTYRYGGPGWRLYEAIRTANSDRGTVLVDDLCHHLTTLPKG